MCRPSPPGTTCHFKQSSSNNRLSATAVRQKYTCPLQLFFGPSDLNPLKLVERHHLLVLIFPNYFQHRGGPSPERIHPLWLTALRLSLELTIVASLLGYPGERNLLRAEPIDVVWVKVFFCLCFVCNLGQAPLLILCLLLAGFKVKFHLSDRLLSFSLVFGFKLLFYWFH